MSNRYTFTITGKVKPAVRMTRRGKYTSSRAQEYLASKDAIAWQLKEQMAAAGWDMLPGQTALAVEIHLMVKAGLNTFDFDNAIKGLCDSANGIVYPDDRWIDACKFERSLGDEYRTTFTVMVIA